MRMMKLLGRNIAIAAFICVAAGAAEHYIGYPAGGLVFISFSIACLFAYVEVIS